MTCKECIHHEVCVKLPSTVNPNHKYYTFSNISEKCECFKDKRKYMPVVYGNWEVRKHKCNEITLYCSVCRQPYRTGKNILMPSHCSWCGAKMKSNEALETNDAP